MKIPWILSLDFFKNALEIDRAVPRGFSLTWPWVISLRASSGTFWVFFYNYSVVTFSVITFDNNSALPLKIHLFFFRIFLQFLGNISGHSQIDKRETERVHHGFIERELNEVSVNSREIPQKFVEVAVKIPWKLLSMNFRKKKKLLEQL